MNGYEYLIKKILFMLFCWIKGFFIFGMVVDFLDEVVGGGFC